MFIPYSEWEDKLTVLVIRNLRTQSDFKDLSDDVEKVVKEAVSDVNTWTLTRDSLTITFGQYTIGPYAAGMPEAHIPWDDLKYYLAPEFQPTTLPTPISKPNTR